MARIPEILAATAIFLPGCASADTPRPISGPVVQEVIATAIAIPCVPKEFAERMGVPTPVSIGGGAASAEIIRLTDRLYRCDETLSDVEKDALRALNANNPLLATPDPAKQVAPLPTNTPAPAPELTTKPETFLPEYSVFFGQMQQEGGTAKGSTIIARLPGYPNQFYVFAIANRSGEGYLYDINKTDGSNTEGVVGWRVGGVYITPTPSQVERGQNRQKINVSLKGDTLIGNLELGPMTDRTLWKFSITNYGTGEKALFEASKKLWAREIANAPEEWQRVPEQTIRSIGFKGIQLP